MVVHQVFAQIQGQSIKNIMVCDNYELANQLTRSIYGDDAFAVECTQYPVSIGDKFIDGTFYFKDGVTPVPRRNTAEEDAQQALTEINNLMEQTAEYTVDLDYRLSALELGIQ